MVNKSLVEYIRKNLQLGYDLNSIQSTLLQSGYNQNQINAAVNYISSSQGYGQQQEYGQAPSSPNTLFLIVIVVAVLFVMFGSILFFMSSPDEPVVDPVPYEPEDEFDDPLETIENPPDETDPIEDELDQNNDDEIVVEDEPEEIIIEDDIEEIDVSIDFSSPRTRQEILFLVDQFSKTDPKTAIKLCQKIESAIPRGDCVQKVALDSKNEDYCSVITRVNTRDSCYLQFVIEDLATSQTCLKIIDEEQKTRCTNLYAVLGEIDEVTLDVTDEQAQQVAEIYSNPALSSPD